MYQISFYVPASHLDVVKEAMFRAGAGRIGDYAACAWQTLGVGQFTPLATSQPYVGRVNQRETLDEYKVELVCEHASIKGVLQALLNTHPYEVPAYRVYEVKTIADF